ncbi:MAG: NAD-dependent epimerase/dehydratase family protein [Myxococcales bacterium]|nr:NAD-dependent epimerase/dehydratase family protein [Myxococcales bacterium]
MAKTNDKSGDNGAGRWGRVLVTGGGGHLGANLVRRLLDDGHEVRALYQPAHDNRGLDGLDVELVPGDLRDLEAMKKAVDGCSHVFHAAAKVSTLHGEEQELFEINVVGTRNLLRAAKEADVERVVVTGSFSAVGFEPDNPSKATSEDGLPFYPFTKHMPYGLTKHLVEHECWWAAASGQDVVVATSCAIIGPNDFIPSRLGRTLCDFANGKLRAFIPGGFEFVASRDIVEGHILAMQKGRSGHKYIFASEYLEVDQLMDLFEEVTGRRRPVRLPPNVMLPIAYVSTLFKRTFFPKSPHRFTPLAVHVLQSRRHADTSKAKRELGFQPTPMRDAIRAAFEFFVEQKMIDGRTSARSTRPYHGAEARL